MKYWKVISALSVIAICDAYSHMAHAQDKPLPPCKPPRFFAHEPNSFVLQQPEGSDEFAIRAHYSFRFKILPNTDSLETEGEAGKACVRAAVSPYELYFKYTGEFDFYAGSRPSGPVINRISNLGLIHGRINFSDLGDFRWVDFGLEHLSNGQVTEVAKGFDANAQAAYLANNYQYFDTISRGTNFVSAEVMWSDRPYKPTTEFHAKLKLDFKNDTHISWGPLANTDTSIKDYDRLQLTLINDVGPGQISVKWTVGDKLASTDSWDFDYLLSKKWAIPLFFRYHTGPLQTLSNYTKSTQSIGVGLKLLP